MTDPPDRRATGPRVRLRPAAADDAALLADLGARTFHDSFGPDNDPDDMAAYVTESFAPEALARQLADPAATFLVAEDTDGRAVGYAQLHAGEPDPAVAGDRPVELARIYVDRDAIGTGVGASLLRGCLDAAAAAGHDTIWLGVWEHNPRAIGFYRRFGFETVGSHTFELGRDRQRDLVMQRRVGV